MPAPASREWALGLWDHGYQVVVAPLRAKRPHVPWKAFQTHRVPREAVEEWFAHGEHNIAILTGAMGGVTKRTPKRTPPALPSPRRCPNPKGEALRCPLPLVHRPQIRYTLHQLLQIPLEPHRAPLLAPRNWPTLGSAPWMSTLRPHPATCSSLRRVPGVERPSTSSTTSRGSAPGGIWPSWRTRLRWW